MMCLLEESIYENYFLFCLLPPILLYDILDYMICLINADTLFTLDDGDIEEIYFWPLLEGIIKECIKLFG